MSTNAEKAYELFKAAIGPEGSGEWFEVNQERINSFADVTEDHQFIHVDPVKSAELSPYKVPIAHGFLTLSMLTHLDTTVPKVAERYAGLVMGINYGFEKVRFISPVKVNSRIRVNGELIAVDLKAPNTIQTTRKLTVEIDGKGKPACVAEWLTRLIYS